MLDAHGCLNSDACLNGDFAHEGLVPCSGPNVVCVLSSRQYYTIIDFNEVDIRIYLPEKVIIHRGR